MLLSEIFKRYKILLLIFLGEIVLIVLMIFFSILFIFKNWRGFDILISILSSLAVLLSGIIALSIVFLSNKMNKVKEKDNEKEDLKNMLIVVRNIIMYCLNFWYLRKRFP